MPALADFKIYRCGSDDAGHDAFAQEKRIQRADLPSAVEKTIVAQSQGATIKGFSQETAKGQVYYEAELTVNGHSKDVLIDANGAIVEIEGQVPLDSLPTAIEDTLKRQGRCGQDP